MFAPVLASSLVSGFGGFSLALLVACWCKLLGCGQPGFSSRLLKTQEQPAAAEDLGEVQLHKAPSMRLK